VPAPTPASTVAGASANPAAGVAIPHQCRWTGVLLPMHQMTDCADSERVEAASPATRLTNARD
jgi:hypothetical protein